jgi:uncharacterized protein (DUF1697 family)
MPVSIVLLRAVNVGGTGRLAMTDFRRLCEEAIVESPAAGAELRRLLQERLNTFTGAPVDVFIRSPEQMQAALDANPFRTQPQNRVHVVFLNAAPPPDPLAEAANATDEAVATGPQEIFIYYPGGQGESRLRLPAARTGTARNLNTVTKLLALARGAGG